MLSNDSVHLSAHMPRKLAHASIHGYFLLAIGAGALQSYPGPVFHLLADFLTVVNLN